MAQRAPRKTNLIPGVVQECLDKSRQYVAAAECLKIAIGGDPSVVVVFESWGHLYGVGFDHPRGMNIPFVAKVGGRCICPQEVETDHLARAIRIATRWLDRDTTANSDMTDALAITLAAEVE